MENEPGVDDEKTEYEYSEDYDDSTSAGNQQRFVLEPTPTQLGPSQRRLGTLVGGDANSMFIFICLFDTHLYIPTELELTFKFLIFRSTTNY